MKFLDVFRSMRQSIWPWALLTRHIVPKDWKKALSYFPQPRSKKLGSEARQVKQNYFSLSGQNGRRVTKAHLHAMVK